MPAAESDEHQISLRVTLTLAERAEALIAHVSAESGKRCTRSDVWREALLRGLRSLERDAQKTNHPTHRTGEGE